MGWDAAKQDLIIAQTKAAIELSFGPSVTTSAVRTPESFSADLLYDLSNLELNRLLGRELVVCTSRQNPQGKEARTLKSSLEAFDRIEINAANLESYKREMLAAGSAEGMADLASRLQAASGPTSNIDGLDPVAAALIAGDIPIAVISRASADENSKLVRTLPIQYPWQLQQTLSQYDKIFAISLRRNDFCTAIDLREVDCTFRSVGRIIERNSLFDVRIGATIASMGREAFMPYARLEQADGDLADVRVRAGELISQMPHPCYIGPGDVLRPTIRRDDRSGQPSNISVVPWTFLVANGGENSTLHCAIFSGVRNALTGRPNRRLHKLATLVRPTHQGTDLKLKIAGKLQVVPGAGIYRRTPGTEDLELIGRSDWRGIIRIEEHKLPEVQYEVPAAEATGQTSDNSPPADKEVLTAVKNTPESEGEKQEQKPAKPPKVEMQTIKIPAHAPLYVYYVKNGTSLLARLPIVTGLDELMVADLPDDSQRLQAEAFLKGLDGEVLDTIARRQILGRKIDQEVKANNVDEAKKLLDELRTVKDYNDFSESLNEIQRRVLAGAGDGIPRSVQSRIDRMFDTTRTNMQKHLQDSLVREKEVLLTKMTK